MRQIGIPYILLSIKFKIMLIDGLESLTKERGRDDVVQEMSQNRERQLYKLRRLRITEMYNINGVRELDAKMEQDVSKQTKYYTLFFKSLFHNQLSI